MDVVITSLTITPITIFEKQNQFDQSILYLFLFKVSTTVNTDSVVKIFNKRHVAI